MPKTWFITGASRGLGAEIVRVAVRAGDQVIAAARNPKAIPDKLGRNRDQVLSVELDVTDASATRAAVDAALSRFGAIDVLVNNAGYGRLPSTRRKRSWPACAMSSIAGVSCP
jgi:NAD(P)-dependent dehydrogenase (short-subunit alcohol dehydrogenase family)